MPYSWLPVYLHLAVKAARHKALLLDVVCHGPNVFLMILHCGSHLPVWKHTLDHISA